MITVHLPRDLADQFHLSPQLHLMADTLDDLISCLDQTAPGMRSWLTEPNGVLRKHLSVVVEGQRVTGTHPSSVPLRDPCQVWILRAISGG